MKKFTLSLFMMIFAVSSYAQLAQETFESWPPVNWHIYNDLTDAPQSTVTWGQTPGVDPLIGYQSPGAAYLNRENLPAPNGRPIDWLITKQFLTPANPVLKFYTKLLLANGQGTEFDIRISEDPNQLAYGSYKSLIDNSVGQFPLSETGLMGSTHTAYIRKAINIPASYVGKQVYIAFVMKGITNGDRWFIDNVSVDSRCEKPTGSIPTHDNPTTTSANLKWVNPSGATTQEIEVVLASASPTGAGTQVSATTSYVWGGLVADTDYKFYIRSFCSATNESDWAGPFLFSTVPLGARCAEPLPILTLPFSTTNTTANFGDFIDNAPGSIATCNGGSSALNGNEVIYKYTATFTGPININMTNNGQNSGMFVYTSCTNIGTVCAAGGIGNTVTPVNINNFTVTNGQDYFIVISTSGSTQTTPYTLIVQAASCDAPANLTVPVIGAQSAELSWVSPPLNTSWQVVVQPAGGGIPQGAGTTTSTNTNYPTGQLQEATVYEYWVRADCNNTTFSAWSGPVTFTTLQIPSTLNYSNDFEGASSGFTFVNGTQVNKWHHGTAAAFNSTKSIYISNDNGVTNAYTNSNASTVHAYRDIQIPSTPGEITISFDWRALGQVTGVNANDYFRVWLVPDNFTINAGTQITAAANQRIKIGGEFNNVTNWTSALYTQDVSQFAGQVRRLVFEWRNDGTLGSLPPAAIDNLNITIVTCPRPQNLAVENPTPTGATIKWDAPAFAGAQSYDYYYSTSDTPPTETTTANGNTTALTVTPTDMAENSTYYIWVRSRCSDANGNSLWVGPVSVITPQIPAILPYTQDFEATDTKFSFISGTLANKWVAGAGTNNGGTRSIYISNTTDGAYGYTVTSATNAVFAYRDFTVPATVPSNNQIEVTFDWKGEGDASDYLKVWIVPTDFNPTPGTPITNATGRQAVGTTFNLNGSWTTVTYLVDIAPYLGQNRRIVFEWRNNATGGLQPPAAIDNLNIKVLTCPSPSAITLGPVTATSADIVWAATTPAPTTYDFYVNTHITSVPQPNTTPTGTIATPGVTLDDEIPAGSTNFYVWVRSNCGTNDLGRWIGPLHVSLPQVSSALNYTDNLEGPIGWTIVNGTQTNKWVVGSAVSSSPSTSLYISNNNGQGNNYTITSTSVVHAYRDIQMTTAPSDISVSFQWKGGGDGVNDRLRVWAVPNTFVPVAGSQIATGADRQLIGQFSENSGSWKNESFVVPSFAYVNQTRRIVFEWINNATVGTQPAMAVDNFNFKVITCPAVTNLTVTGGALLGDVFMQWTPVGTETQWELVIQEQELNLPGENPPTVVIVNGTPQYTFTATPGTFYEYYVRPVCSPSDKGLWAGPVSFSVFAPPACAKVDLYDEDLEVIAPGTNFSICPGEDACVDLKAEYLETGSTASYAVETIDYAPQFPFTGGIQLNISTDDRWGPAFNFPADFNFCFYGTKQTKATVGSNGVVSFNTHTEGSTCPFNLNGLQIPNTAFPIRNAIYGVYQDINPAINNDFANPTINYQILGTYPCRAFVVNFSEVAQFSSATCSNNPTIGAQTSQIVFYEISNIIEVYVKRRVPCMAWPLTAATAGQGLIGIQNAAGTAAVAPPGRNTGSWTAIEEAYRFTPNGPSNVVFGWYEGPNLLSTNDNISVCVTTQPRTVIARATYKGCGPDTVVETPVTITPEQPIIVTQTTNLLNCAATGTTTATFNLMDGVAGAIANPQNYTFTFYDTQAKADVGVAGTELPTSYTSGDATIWVRIQLTGRTCYAVNSFTVKVKTAPTFDLPADFAICQGQTGTIAITNANFDLAGATVSYVWNSGALPDTGSSIAVTTAGTYTVLVNFDGCTLSKSVNVTVNPVPVADAPSDVTVCTSYTLPALSAGNNYYTGANATGTMLAANTAVTATQTIYVHAAGATPDCYAENSFIVTIENAPALTAPANPSVCQSYSLPALTVGNYYTGPGGTGTMLNAGDPITNTQQIYIYAVAGTQSCPSEVTFTVTITPDVVADVLPGTTVCDTYELPLLSQYNNYYTGTGGSGTLLAAGSDITSTQTIYIFAKNGICQDQSSFTVNVVPKPLPVAIEGACQGGQYVLSAIFSPLDTNYNPGNVAYAWSRSEGGAVIGTGATFVAADSGDYYLTVSPIGSTVGCASDAASVDVSDNTCLIQKGISPNNDGKNDNFDLTAYNVTNISIFNRYGKEVFNYGAYTNQWHGQDNGGDELPTGTYYYSYKRATGEEVTGWIYINREEN